MRCRYFTWDKSTFADPIRMQEGLAAHGRKLVTIVDPHIKKDPNYYIYKEAQDKGLYVLNKDKQEFDGCAILQNQVTLVAERPIQIALNMYCPVHSQV